MSTDNLNIKEDRPLANSTTITEEYPVSAANTAEDVITVFDLVSEIEMTLKSLQAETLKNDRQFHKSIDLIEEKLGRGDQ